MTKIEWTEEAIRDVEKLDKTVAQRVLRKLTWLSKNFQAITPEPLSRGFQGAYKLRVGDWRVIYTLEEKSITIQLVGHRKEIYENK